MGFFKKISEKFKIKKSIAKQIAENNEVNKVASQTKFDDGLKKSANSLQGKIDQLAKKYKRIDDQMIEAIEESLLSFDVGTVATRKIVDAIVNEIKYQNVDDPQLIKQIIIDKLFIYYIQDTITNTELNIKDNQTNVILVVGVNGVGKTTTTAKLANKFIRDGKTVSLVAGDTFRAGAVEQLKVWANKLNINITLPKIEGQDPASVIYEGVKWGYENKIDIVLCDTSGRLQNKINLMNELKKINNVIKKYDSYQPCETLLVLDATTGQSGILQAKAFNEITNLTGIILTKMDSTSAGGIVLSIKDNYNLPVKYIGLGEGINDLSLFDLEKYIDGLTQGIKL